MASIWVTLPIIFLRRGRYEPCVANFESYIIFMLPWPGKEKFEALGSVPTPKWSSACLYFTVVPALTVLSVHTNWSPYRKFLQKKSDLL
jgi:hypothetical protein